MWSELRGTAGYAVGDGEAIVWLQLGDYSQGVGVKGGDTIVFIEHVVFDGV